MYCKERRVCPVSGSTRVHRKSRQDPMMTSANQIERKWQHQRKPREKCQGQRRPGPDKQQATGRAASCITRQGCQEKEMWKQKEFQELLQSTVISRWRSHICHVEGKHQVDPRSFVDHLLNRLGRQQDYPSYLDCSFFVSSIPSDLVDLLASKKPHSVCGTMQL